MQQPEGFIEDDKKKLVCKLQRPLYGLKQGGREWNQKLDTVLTKLNLTQSAYNACIYHYFNEMKLIIVAIFVDDFFVFSNSAAFISMFREQIQKIFSVKNLGPVKRCLGIDVVRDRKQGTIRLSQANYVTDILARFGMEG